MINFILQDKKLFFPLLLWLIAGIISPWLAMVIIPLHILKIDKVDDDAKLIMLLGFWFILILSDSYQAPLRFAGTVKPIVLLTLSYIIYRTRPVTNSAPFYSSFILFFIISIYCWFDSPYQAISFQKTLSYFLLLLIIPPLTNELLATHRDRFLINLIVLGATTLGIGLALRILAPDIVLFMGDRYSGIFGNPNGLGMFSFLFLGLFHTIQTYHKHLFPKHFTWVVYGMIALSLYMCGSRGGIFASALFLIGSKIFQSSKLLGLLAMSSILIAYQISMNNLEALITTFNLQSYFRLETLESGSGRQIAWDFALKNIQNHYWFGRGMGFAEQLMHESQDYFSKLGHVGNVHNSYLTMWLDTGLLGLMAFIYAWGKHFINAFQFSPLAGALFFGVVFSSNVESWLAGSLNPFTIQLIITLALLTNPHFYKK